MVACKKDDAPGNNNNKSKAALLTKAAWKQTNQEFKIGTGNYTLNPEFAELENCEKDNLSVFKADKTIEENEGATKCDPDDPQITGTGKWEFLSNETQLKAITGEDSYEATIDKLDQNTLQLSFSGEVLVQQVGYRFTFMH